MILRWHNDVAVGLAALWASPLAAQALSCAPPERLSIPYPERPKQGEAARKTPISGYSLALSWSPEFCAGSKRKARDATQCSGTNGRFGFVLHGLWPETTGRKYPMWCRPAKLVPPVVLRRSFCMTPSVQLLQHEWAKHGTCMSPDPLSYFSAASILFRAVRYPDMTAHSRRPTTVGAFKAAFAAANPGVRPSMVAVTTGDNGALKEVRVCLGKRMRPEPCASGRRGAPDRVRLTIRAQQR